MLCMFSILRNDKVAKKNDRTCFRKRIEDSIWDDILQNVSHSFFPLFLTLLQHDFTKFSIYTMRSNIVVVVKDASCIFNATKWKRIRWRRVSLSLKADRMLVLSLLLLTSSFARYNLHFPKASKLSCISNREPIVHTELNRSLHCAPHSKYILTQFTPKLEWCW